MDNQGYEKALKHYRLRRIFVRMISILIGISVLVSLSHEFMNPNIYVPSSEITISYGSPIPTNQFRLLSAILGISININENMFKYDPDIIGESQTAKIEYLFIHKEFILIIEPAQLSIPEIHVSNNTLYIVAQTPTPQFEVMIDDSASIINAFNYDLSDVSIGDHQVKVRAISPNDIRYAPSDYTEIITIKKLNMISDISYNDGKLIWAPIEDSSSYKIWINNILYDSDVNELVITLTQRNNTIKVQGVGASSNFISSTITEIELIKLVPVTNIVYNNQRITWDSSETEYQYYVIINGDDHITTNDYFDIPFTVGVHDVSVQVIDESQTAIDSDVTSTQISYYKIDAPELVVLEGESLSSFEIEIHRVEYADLYKVYINKYIDDEHYSVDSITSDGMESILINIDTFIKFELYAEAYNEYGQHETSEYSDMLVIYKLSQATNINYANGKLTWDQISGASSYNIWINNMLYNSDMNELTVDFTQRINTIEIQGVGSSALYISSNITEIELTKLLSVTNIRYTNQQLIWDSIETDYKYLLVIDDQDQVVTNNYLDIVLTIGVHTISVQVIDESHNAIDSNVTTVQIGYEQLAQPQVTIIQGMTSTSFSLTVTQIENADQYEVNIIVYSGNDIEWSNSIVLEDELSHQFFVSPLSTRIVVTVIAKDSNGNYASSNEISEEFII
jgi:hypothetical protein